MGALVSATFHAVQVQFGGSCGCGTRRVVIGAAMGTSGTYPVDQVVRLLLCDVVCASSYACFLVLCRGPWESLSWSWPLVLLATSVALRKRGSPRGYVVVHGLWHLCSARVIYSAAWP